MASGGYEDGSEAFSHPHPPPPLFTSTSIGQEVSGSWMNLSGSVEQHEFRLPKRASDIMPVLKLKLAILSGGRDDQGRVIVTFPVRPRGTQYDHTQLLQTIQYLSTVPSIEAQELGFVLVIDGRLLSWSDVKMILRTAQEALPGQVHVAYIVQSNQFVQKQQISMGLSKEKDKVEFSIVKVSSVEKLVRHIDQRQVTFDMSGSLKYSHEEWLKLRTITELLLDAYQEYISNASQLETQLKPSSAMSPERLSDLQIEMGRLESIQLNIQSADTKVVQLCDSLKTEIEANSGSSGLTPEMVNCLATVTRISQNAEQQQKSLKDLCEQSHRKLGQLFSLKQFELGLAKVKQWIKNKGMDKALRVDIGDSIPKVLSIQDDLKKLESKAEAVATDVAEIRRIADIMAASDHYAKDSVKERLKKMNSKYSKFKSVLEKRRLIVTTSVAMFKGISEWRQLYDEHTTEWNSTNSLKCTESAKELLASLESQYSHLKELAQSVLTQGQELVKCLKSSGISQGDPDFRKSLRFISRVTEEVTEKLRRCQETTAIRRARLDQYVQLLVCERDGKEGIKSLQGILQNLETSHGGVGTSLETVTSISTEVEQHEEEVKRTHEYAKQLLQVAFKQREQLSDKDLDKTLLTELNDLASLINGIITKLKHRLDLSRKLFSVFEPTQVTVKQWMKLAASKSPNESFVKEIKENKDKVLSSLHFCKDIILLLQELLKQPSSNSTVTNPSVNESSRRLNEVLSMIEAQEQQLCTDLENKKLSMDQAGRLKSIEQSIEDILIWLREYGLSQFAEFLTLGFTLATVQDQWTEFCAFRETCQGLTHQVDELEKSIQKEGEERSHHEETLVKTSKRVSDLNRVWRRFLIRVQNREKVLSSLHQFLLESVKLASVMSEMVKSTDFQEKQSALQSSYHLTVDQGKRLVVLLRDSPDGSQDSQIADKVAARMKHLTDLYQQIQPLIRSSSHGSPASNDTVLRKSEHNSVTSVDDSLPYQMKEADKDTTVSAGDTVTAKLSSDKKVEETVEDVVVDDVFESEGVVHTSEDKVDEKVPKTAKDIFEEAEAVITMLIEEFLISVMEFMQSHDVFPSQPDKVDQELTQHDKFLDRKRIDVEDLKNRVTSLRAYAQHANVPANRIDHIVMRVGNKLPGRISLFERRLTAFRKFSQLCKLRKKCIDLRAEFDTFLSESSRRNVHDKDVQVLLKACISHLKQLESLTLQCSTLSRDFTEISSEIEMRGVDARKTMRQIRQDIEEFSYNYNHSLNRRKKMLEASVQIDDIGIKLGELMQWISDTGMPFINTITYGKSRAETQKCLENVKAMNSKRESISAEIIAVTEVVESVDTSLTTLNQSKELKLANTELQKLFTSRCQVLEATEQYFASADALIDELQTAMSPREHSVQALNPLVVDKLYTTLNAQADYVCRSLNAVRGTNIQSTVESVGERLSQAEKLTSKYLLSCTCDSHQDIAPVFSLLDNLLLEIQNDVQEAINTVTGKEEMKEVKRTPVKQTLRISSRISSSTTPEKSPRKGTVSNLKKLFESGSKPSEPQSPVNQSTNTYASKRRLSTSSLVVDSKLLAQLAPESKADDEKSNALLEPKTQSETTSASTDVRTVDLPVSDGVVIVKTKEAPLHSAITVNITSFTNNPPPIPPLPPAEEPPKRPPPPPEPSDVDSDSLPPTPPPVRPPPPLQSDESSQDPFELIREPVYKESTLLQFQKIDGESHDHDVLSNPSSQEPHSSYYTSEESQCDPSSSEHTPRVRTPQGELNDNSQFDNEHFERYYPEEPIGSLYDDDYLGDTSSDVYSSQNGHYTDRVINLKMEDSIRHRDLSPVIEEADEDDLVRDHPDIGWKKDKVDKKKDLEWSRAHKQSLLSMKAIINEFYQDEVVYTDTLSRLLKVYVPILQHTGIFNTMYPIVEFQQVFLTQLSHSIATIPELCVCFQQNLENFKLYFPFVLGYDTALKIITNINPDELSSLLPLGSKSSESDMIQGYTAPYHRIEIYCSLFQHLLRAAFKEDLMNLAALSETLECLLDLLRILAMELATTKLTGCPFHVSAADIVAMNPFLVHLANEVKEVYLYTVFLHPEALVISERLLDESKEHTIYAYIMHIPISGMILVENFHGLADRFAVCEKGQVATQNFVVFRSCEDISVKDYWVNQLKVLLQKDIECLTPRETLQPEQVEQISSLLPTTAPPPPGASNRLDPLRRRKSLKRQRKRDSRDDLIDGYDTPESPAIENVYRVTMDHRTSGPLANEYLNVSEGDLVEVLEIKGNNYYVARFSVNSSSEEEEEEGFVPACCLEPLAFKEELNRNSNNNANPQNIVENSPDERIAVNEDDLRRDWTVFCLRTGRTEPFPSCSSEQELLNAKMDSLVKYYSDQHQLLGLSSCSFKATADQDSVDGNTVRSDTAQESARRLLYMAEFLGPVLEEEPSCAQLDGVLHTVMPTTTETQTDIQVTRDEKHPNPIGTLRVSTFLERPTNMRKCGNLYCQGDYIFKEWKPRFLALILLSQFRFLLCHYLPKDHHPKDIISLDGCNVDYLEEGDPILSRDLPYGFVLTTPKGTVKFACKTYNERETWVNGLFRVTGQSNKPSDEQDGSSSHSLAESELSEVVNMDVTQLDHQQLFTKLFKEMLSYRLDQQVFSRGLFSSSQMYIVDEYCARYSVRLSHRHLTCLREWLSCELRGISIWPVMMLHSFGFCQMHIMGKAPQQHSEVVLPQERQEWTETSAQIELLLIEKLENFRTFFPFSCPKDDLKITMKLFALVADINHCEDCNMSAVLISEKQPMKLLNKVMATAALNNFKHVYSKLWQNERDEYESQLTVEQLYVLGKLCIDFMYELHDYYSEDFVLYPEAFNAHIDAFWSFFMVDLRETMLGFTPSDVVPLLKMFYLVNEYFILQPTLKLSVFHNSLLTTFEPIVDDYLTGLDTSITNDMKAFFDNETWTPVSECCGSMKGCIDALESVKQFVENLHWPQDPFRGDLIYRVQNICANKFKDAVRFTRLQCESSANAMTVKFDTIVPKPVITMINTMMFLTVQAVPFCGLGNDQPEQDFNRHTELSNELQSFLETTLGDVFRTVIHKLCEPLQLILKQMSRLDPHSSIIASLKSMLPSLIQTEQYQLFMKQNYQHLSGTLVTAVFSQFMLNWYETQLRIASRWLRNRPDFSLHSVQLESVESIVDIIRDQFLGEDIDEQQFNTETFEEIEDRIKREHSQAAMMKAFKKS